MRVTIVPVDGVVGVDGEFRKVAGLAEMYPNVHAIQWGERGEQGHVELTDGAPNGGEVTLSDLQPALDAWHALTPPPPTAAELLTEAKVKQITLITDAYTAENKASINYAGHTFQADEESVALMAQVATALPAGASIDWYDAANVKVPLTDAQFTELRGVILMRGQPLFAKRRQLKDAIAAAATVAEVEKVVW